MNKIPKIAHFFWGNSPMSYLNYLTFVSFKKYHPEWEMYFHVAETSVEPTWGTHEQKMKYEGKDYLEQAKELCTHIIPCNFTEKGFTEDASDVHKADFLRNYLMHEVGGMWCDTDVIWIKPVESLGIPENTDFTIVKGGLSTYLSGIVLAKPHTEFFKRMYEGLFSNYVVNQYQCLGVVMQESLFPEVKHIKVLNENFIDIPHRAFYPFLWNEMNLFFIENHPIPEETVAVHWYGGAEISMKQKTVVTENYNMQTTFKKVLDKCR